MIKKVLLILSLCCFVSCINEKNENEFTISTWTGAGNDFKEEIWIKKISYYDSLGISEILVGGSPDVLRKIIPLANKKKYKSSWLDVDSKQTW